MCVNVMESSEKSMGKTHQGASFIREMSALDPPRLDRVLVIYHRRSLIDDAFDK